MSVLVKGMEMPKSCDVCDFVVELDEGALGSHNYCGFPGNGVYVDDCIAARHKNCPFEPVPPHGRLIDADALDKLFEDQWHYLQVLDWNENPTAEATQSGINWCINTMHDDAPTIIPAEEGE